MNQSLLARAALIALATAGLASTASAATVTLNQTLDLTLASFAPSGFTGVQGAPAFSPAYNVAIAVGDTFDYTIDFTGGQNLTLTNASFLWAFSYSGSPSSSVTGTGTLSLLDSSGNAFLTSSVKTTTEGSVHFGQQYNNGDFSGALTGNVTFYGLRYTGTLDAYGASISTRDYNQAAFYFTAEGNRTSVVPEPQTYALLLAGLGVVGLMARRREGR